MKLSVFDTKMVSNWLKICSSHSAIAKIVFKIFKIFKTSKNRYLKNFGKLSVFWWFFSQNCSRIAQWGNWVPGIQIWYSFYSSILNCVFSGTFSKKKSKILIFLAMDSKTDILVLIWNWKSFIFIRFEFLVLNYPTEQFWSNFD